MLLILAALPSLFWDGSPDTAGVLREAGIERVAVPSSKASTWSGIAGLRAEAAAGLESAIKLLTPTVNYRMNEASATNSPWIVANGWKIVRRPQSRFYYDASGKAAAIAAAEAFMYGAQAWVKTDAAGLQPFAEMTAFLSRVGESSLPPVADIGYLDDGSPTSGEVMNLLARSNLLFRIVPAPDPHLKINVKLGSRDYPLEDAKNPSNIAHAVRYHLTDDKRSLRLYGSQVVIGRLQADGGRARLHLLNYSGATRAVNGIRVRVAGIYPKHRVDAAGLDKQELLDYTVDAEATEFTVPDLRTYAVIDLSK